MRQKISIDNRQHRAFNSILFTLKGYIGIYFCIREKENHYFLSFCGHARKSNGNQNSSIFRHINAGFHVWSSVWPCFPSISWYDYTYRMPINGRAALWRALSNWRKYKKNRTNESIATGTASYARDAWRARAYKLCFLLCPFSFNEISQRNSFLGDRHEKKGSKASRKAKNVNRLLAEWTNFDKLMNLIKVLIYRISEI